MWLFKNELELAKPTKYRHMPGKPFYRIIVERQEVLNPVNHVKIFCSIVIPSLIIQVQEPPLCVFYCHICYF